MLQLGSLIRPQSITADIYLWEPSCFSLWPHLLLDKSKKPPLLLVLCSLRVWFSFIRVSHLQLNHLDFQSYIAGMKFLTAFMNWNQSVISTPLSDQPPCVSIFLLNQAAMRRMTLRNKQDKETYDSLWDFNLFFFFYELCCITSTEISRSISMPLLMSTNYY